MSARNHTRLTPRQRLIPRPDLHGGRAGGRYPRHRRAGRSLGAGRRVESASPLPGGPAGPGFANRPRDPRARAGGRAGGGHRSAASASAGPPIPAARQAPMADRGSGRGGPRRWRRGVLDRPPLDAAESRRRCRRASTCSPAPSRAKSRHAAVEPRGFEPLTSALQRRIMLLFMGFRGTRSAESHHGSSRRLSVTVGNLWARRRHVTPSIRHPVTEHRPRQPANNRPSRPNRWRAIIDSMVNH